MKIFGFEITRSGLPANERNEKENTTPSFVTPQTDDGAITVQTGGYFGTYVDLDGAVRNEVELITRYREMSIQPELEIAIDEIVNEAIVQDDESATVKINVDDVPFKKNVKDRITQEFENMLGLLDFQNMGHDIFKRWYVDGRLFYHIIIDVEKPEEGIQEIRYIDPRKIRKIREIKKKRDPHTGVELIDNINEFYLFNERNVRNTSNAGATTGIKIAADSIVNINSGILDASKPLVLSYLHKAIKPLNQLRMLEDASVIYRLARAPERRIFYIDVGNMPTAKAEQYLRDTMVKYRNKFVYDSTTGEIKDDRKHLSMLEDFWLPRREGGKGTQIDTLKGGENLGKMEDVEYFERKLYKSLGVPMSRLEPTAGFSMGRSTEITREELKFAKFIARLRQKFSILFDELLKRQLIMKRVIVDEDWKVIKENIWYDFLQDNNFSELKESELLQNKLAVLQMIDMFNGKYYSTEWIRRNVLKQDDDEIEEIDDQIAEEQETASLQQQQVMGGGFGQQQQPDQFNPQQQQQQPGMMPPIPTNIRQPAEDEDEDREQYKKGFATNQQQ